MTSTHAAEFMALKEGTEQVMNMCYYLRCLGVPIPNDGTHPTKIFGDNFSVIQSASNPKADLNKKHISLSFHFVERQLPRVLLRHIGLKGN